MDERTRKSDEGLAPNLRRTSPDPIVKGPTFTTTRVVVGLIIVVLLGLGAYQIGRWALAPQPATGRRAQLQAGLQSVGAATVTLNNVPVVVNALGTVTPIATVTVQSQISGYLTNVNFTEGQLVQRGAPIAQIDQRPYEVLKAQYEGQLAHDQGLLSQAQMDLKRYQLLEQQNSIAKQQAEDQVFIVQQYEGSVKQDQGLVDAQTLNIAYCNIISPVTGRIGLRLVDPGNYVQSDSATGLAVITQLQPITVIFSIPEDDLPDVMPQMNSGTKLQVTAFDRANVKQLGVGNVIAVDSQIDTTTGTVKVRAQFENTDYALFPNQFVNARLLVKTLQNAVSVPSAAIQLGSPGTTPGSPPAPYVYAIDNESKVQVKQVITGPTFIANGNSMTAITSGLSQGEHVVTDGADRLRAGLSVNVTTLDGKPVQPTAAPANGPGEKRNRGEGRRSGNGSQ
ncbi:MAG TPA: efflux RND transporter periplasmic adaptor subunit [Xanthobacteraceae bacterium]|nr:efflux RND transporter periplasmic adaptor subunit [Xanthobacteraceae bacterium]